MTSGKNIGLLQKANLLSQKQGLAFCDFIAENKISIIAKFSLIENYFYINNSFGFDAASIIGSKSTIDFWNGIAPIKNKLYTFSAEEKNISSLFQFFSFVLKDSIDSIQIVRTLDTVFMICNTIIKENQLSDLFILNEDFPEININSNLIPKDAVISKIEISTKNAIANYLTEMEVPQNTFQIYSKAIDNEISNQLFFNFSNTNFIGKKNNYELQAAIISSQSLPEKMLRNHIVKNISLVLENFSELIECNLIGKAQNYSDLLSFIKAE